MKKILFVSAIVIFISCKKNGDSIQPANPVSFSDFIKNTEWVGTLNGNGFQYPPPCSLKFNNGNDFTMYSHFVFFPGGVEVRKDSITGTISAIDSMADGRTRITTSINTSFNPVVTQYIYISDRKKITGVSSDGTVATFQLERFPANGISVYSTHWRGPQWPVSSTSYAYPDLSSIIFQPDGINTVYSFNGQPVMLTQLDPLQHIYLQVGARVYMSGYKFLPGGAAVTVNNYLGILQPSGDKMMVDSYSPDARLPNYINTNQPYGPNGQTPIIYKY